MKRISAAYSSVTPSAPESREDKYIAENLGSPRKATMLASGRNAYLDAVSLKSIFNIANYHGHDPDMLYLKEIHDSKEENQKITQEKFANNYADSGLEYDPNFTPAILDEILEKRRKMDINNYIIENGKGDLLDKAGQIAGGIVGGNIAPTNLAINAATSFTPIGFGLKSAWWAANPVKTSMVKFAIGGGIGEAALEPFIHQDRRLEQREYTLTDSISNIAEASAFSAVLPLIGAGIKHGYAIGKGKYSSWRSRYFASPEELNTNYATGNSSLDMQFKHLIDEQSLNSAPSEFDITGESFETLNKNRITIRNKGQEKFPEFFDFEDKLASLEKNLHKEFASDGDVTMLPDQISSVLTEHKKKLHSIYEKYQDNPEFQEINHKLNNINEIVSHKLKQEQFESNGYNLDQTDLAIARNQLDSGKHIDLDDPSTARSIFDENYGNYESIDIKKQISELEELTSSSPNYEQYQYEHQQSRDKARLSGKEIDSLKYRDKLMDSVKLENAKQTIISDKSTKSIKDNFIEVLRQTDIRGAIVSRELETGLMNDLVKADLLDFFKNKKFEASIAQELWNITHPNKTATNSKIAENIASIVHKWQQQGVARMNNAGGNIETLAGYITRQSHSSFKIKKDGYDKWRNFIAPLLDVEKLDTNLDLKQVWMNLATGHHLYQNNEYMPIFSGSINIADKFAYARKLHFKSPSSWLKYNNEYGTHGLAHSIAINLDKLGRNIGIIEKMGSNPYEFLSKLKNQVAHYLQEKAASGNKNAKKQLDFILKDNLDKRLEFIIGITPDNPKLATISQGLRNWITMSNLGKVVISSLPDIGSFIAEQMHNGMPYLKAQGNIIKAATNMFNSKEKQEFARLLGVGTDNLMGLSYSRLNVENQLAGKINTATNYYFKLNLMDWWDNSFKSALGFVLSNNLAHHAKSSYKKAPLALKNNLKRYGIDEKDWSALKSFIKKADDGREYIIAPEWKSGNTQINQTATKFRTYLQDRVDTGIPSPHALDRYSAALGTRAGTPLGEVARFLMQFKQFPITYWNRSVKDYQSTPKILSTMLILSTIGGYASIAANNLLSGKEVPELNIDNLQAAMLKGGGLGLYGDFIFGEHNRYGHNIYQTMASPAMSGAADIASIMSDVIEGKVDDATKKAQMLIRRNTPCRNLFYLAPALMGARVSDEWIDRNLNARF